MFLKEIRLIQNDRYALLLIFVLPAMIMGTMWLALEQRNFAPPANSEGKNEDALIIGLVDDDPTDTYPGQDLSENFTWYLQNSPNFIITLYDTEEEALIALYQDTVNAYAVIPYGFEGNITGLQPGPGGRRAPAESYRPCGGAAARRNPGRTGSAAGCPRRRRYRRSATPRCAARERPGR